MVDRLPHIPQTLFIKELIRRVHQELIASKKEREDTGEDAIFEVASMSIEVHFVVTESTSAKGGLDFKILTAGAATEYKEQQIHKLTLTLKALGLTDLESFRPREKE